MIKRLQLSLLLLTLPSVPAPAVANERPIFAPASGADGDAAFNPSILIGKALFTDDGVKVGTVTRVVALAAGHFLIVAELNDEVGGGQRTVQISSKAASFTKNGVRLETTADAFRKTFSLQMLNPLGGRNE